jgi:hypothetical protein
MNDIFAWSLQSKLIALFPAEQDVNESLSFAFQAIGLKEMLPYKIESVQHEDWEQEVKVCDAYDASLFLLSFFINCNHFNFD